MGKAFINDTTITNIANAIRSKFGLTGTLKLSDMLTTLQGVKKPGSYVWSKSSYELVSDVKTWAQSNITSGTFYSVYYGNGIWVAGSSDGLYYSTDGMTWTQSNVTGVEFYSVYCGNSIWVAGSNGSGLYYSEDGRTWVQSNTTNGSFYSLYYNNGLWVACNYLSNTGLWYSDSVMETGEILGYIVGDNESDYPDKAVQDGYYYEKVLPASLPFVPEIEA